MTIKQKNAIGRKAIEIKRTLTKKQMKEWKEYAKWSANYFGVFGGLPF